MGRRKLIRPTKTKYKERGQHVGWRVYYLNKSGERVSSIFKTDREANHFLDDKKAEAENLGGEVAAALTNDTKRSLFNAIRRLEPYKKTLDDAIDFYVQHLEAIQKSSPVQDLIPEFLSEMKRAERSSRYIYDLDSRLKRFAKDHGKSFASEISTKRAQRWLNGLQVSERTRNHYRTVLGTFFGWAERMGYTPENPVTKTTKARIKGSDIEIFSVDELSTVLAEAAKLPELDILATTLLGGFAGLRSSEAERLNWKDIDLERGTINLSWKMTKTASRRVVDIQPNLKAWLEKYFPDATGPIKLPSYQNRLTAFRNGLKNLDPPIDWPHNGLRHSFASYLLEFKGSREYASKQLGHAEATLIYSNYRELVTSEDAGKYWRIYP